MESGAAGATMLCQLRVGEQLHTGPVRDLSPAGFRVETEIGLEPGTEVELRLLGASAPNPVYLRAVVEQRVVPTDLNPDAVAGLKLRILHFDRSYLALLGSPQGGEADEEADLSGFRTRRDSAEREWLVSLTDRGPEEGAARAVPAAERDPHAGWGPEEGVDLASMGVAAAGGAPDVLVVDEGELEDVVWLLEELGIEPERRALTPGLEDWVAPQRLLVVSARRALALRLPLRGVGGQFAAIAVTDGETQTVEAAMRRLGYRLVVKRPVHPEALRTLLSEVLFEGSSRRKARRQALGCEVRWRSGWWRTHGAVLVDLSLGGCRLLTPVAARAGAPISIRIPPQVTGGRPLRLRGHVARSAPLAGPGCGGLALGVEFGELPERTRTRLAALVADSERGPRRLADAPAVTAPAPGSPLPDRRRAPRSELREEVLALDPREAQVEHTLRGRDLSLRGVRVEPHPDLALGAKLRLVIRVPGGVPPVLVDAEVARDDGPRGLWLRFVEVSAAMRERVERAVAVLPPVGGARRRRSSGP